MYNPLISVVVPTRERPDTLEVMLRALSRHQSERIEIVVQDNFGSPETAKIVSEAAKLDPRIRYSHSLRATSQRHNFELGLAAARGEYMTIIGDDDGFCLGSLDWLVKQLEQRPVDAVRWNLVTYIWPSLSSDDVGFINLHSAQCFGSNFVTSAKPIADSAIKAGTLGSWDNILVYHGMISRRVYDRMRSMTDGVFFPYPMPDVYAHNVLPFFCNEILQVNDIVSIYGSSGHSAGASWTRAPDKTDQRSAAEGARWMAESIADPIAGQTPWHPEIRTLRYHDYAALRLAESHGMLAGYEIDQAQWVKAMINEIRAGPWQLEELLSADERAPFDGEVFSAIRRYFAANPIAESVPLPRKHTADPRIPAIRVAQVNPSLLDDVEGACLAIAKITGDIATRYNDISVNARPEFNLIALIKKSAIYVQRKAPRFVHRVLESRLMPRPLWRFLKKLSRPADSRSEFLQRRLDTFKTVDVGQFKTSQ